MLGTIDDVTIMRLRVKGSNLDPQALQPRLRNLIGDLSVQPMLPASAIVFIRKLTDPLPGLLQLESTDSRASQTWRRGFGTRFEQLVTSAARPALGPVSSSAESVVFYDYSELLACLTTDSCNGFVAARWWWHSFTTHGDIAQIIKRYWREKIEYAPAALEQLARRKVLVDFVGAISEQDARKLVERLIYVFSLKEIANALDSSNREMASPSSWGTDFPHVDTTRPAAPKETPVRVPWAKVVPESETSRLGPIQQLFLGVALMIRRAPDRVRTVSFAHEVKHWWQQLTHPSGSTSSVETEDEKDNVQHSLTALDDLTEPWEVPTVTHEVQTVSSFVDSKFEQVRIGNTVFRQATQSLEFSADSQNDCVAELSSEAYHASDTPIVRPESLNEAMSQPQASSDDLCVSITIETELGGFFYMINLAIFLGLYKNFTGPVESFSGLNIWDFVALVADELNQYRDHDDPIWSLLANLAGRDVEVEPGLDFEPPEDWRPSPQWLEEIDAAWNTNYEASQSLRCWLDRLLPYLSARLRLALGVDNQVDLGKILLNYRARVIVTPTHIDVFFTLANLPIEIRLAGLDRNPGWVPAAGRFIAFHYD